jgi:hypothetical protein
MIIEAMRQALEALEMLARYENPETRIQVRKPKDSGPIVTMCPHKVATDAADVLRTAIAEAEKHEPYRVEQSLYGEEMKLYTTPPAAQRQPLTADETMRLMNETAGNSWGDEAHIQRFRAAIEVAHGIGEKNT